MSAGSESSTGAGSSNDARNSTVCFCRRCDAIFTTLLSPQLLCPNCGSTDEVQELDIYMISSDPPSSSSSSSSSSLVDAIREHGRIVFGMSLFTAFLSGGFRPIWQEVNLIDFLDNHLPRIRAGDIGATLELAVIRPSPPSFTVDGGYLDFEELAEFLKEHAEFLEKYGFRDPSLFVNPPGSSQKYLDRLPSIRIGENTKNREDDDNEKCAVCLDEFGSDDVAKQLPCSHLFHLDCILQCLSNKCPMCRHQLTAADQLCENRQGGDPGDSISGEGDGREVSGSEFQ